MHRDSESINLMIHSIGIVRSPFASAKGMPLQPCAAAGHCGTIEIFERYIPGLQDLEGFSHIMVLYWLHAINETKLVVTPFLDQSEHGIFATRSPARPNKIGISILPLLKISKGILEVGNMDILHETPVLDIKPFVPEFDVPTQPVRIGWLENKVQQVHKTRDDGRFAFHHKKN